MFAALTFLSAGFASVDLHAQDAHKTYEWSANLISFDSATDTAVLQARVESYVQIPGLEDFSDGDRLILTWTGRTWAAGIRGLAEDPELTPDTLSLPVEFVSSERDGQYINFRVPVPAGSVDAIAGMEPGMRVTGVSPRMATNWTTGVSLLRHYNDVS
jgi:hypothetical protein